MHCGSEDIMILVCHVVLQGYVMKGSCDFMGRSPFREVLVCQMILTS